MGLLDMHYKDLHRYRLQFVEAAKMRGVPCKYLQVDTTDFTVLADKTYVYKEEISINIFFEENPKVKFLEKLGWLVEGEQNPYVVYLPVYDEDGVKINVSQGCLIKIKYRSTNEVKVFFLEDVKTPMYETYYLGKLRPYREIIEVENPGVGNKWLKDY